MSQGLDSVLYYLSWSHVTCLPDGPEALQGQWQPLHILRWPSVKCPVPLDHHMQTSPHSLPHGSLLLTHLWTESMEEPSLSRPASSYRLLLLCTASWASQHPLILHANLTFLTQFSMPKSPQDCKCSLQCPRDYGLVCLQDKWQGKLPPKIISSSLGFTLLVPRKLW